MNSNQDIRILDCVQFKDDLHKKSFSASGAKNFDEYINYVNQKFIKSPWNNLKEAHGKQIQTSSSNNKSEGL
ncbi:hypothetical protein FACS1894172_10550 [Spirochaetia bacterium]|nr:hypothetical protein FACS1894164_10430 [Spirochaetia bacterium]GHU32958.1 hypothetical protein FACS1894172_10550 [Spirochaetia bacterium]